MANLLTETLEELHDNGRDESDVLWVGNKNVYSTWEDFKQAANTEYDDGFGCQEVAHDLIIVGENWWLERHEYDGSEWWEYKIQPHRPSEKVEIRSVIGGMWDNLEKINKLVE